MQNQLLLLEDVDGLGRSGEVVTVKPGYARNFLFPQHKAVVADKRVKNLQAKLVEERAKKAVVDKAEAESIAAAVAALDLSVEVKTDPEGKLYGSVTAADVLKLLEKENIVLEQKSVVLLKPIKQIGSYQIDLKLKEGILASLRLTIRSDRPGLQPASEPMSEESLPEETADS